MYKHRWQLVWFLRQQPLLPDRGGTAFHLPDKWQCHLPVPVPCSGSWCWTIFSWQVPLHPQKFPDTLLQLQSRYPAEQVRVPDTASEQRSAKRQCPTCHHRTKSHWTESSPDRFLSAVLNWQGEEPLQFPAILLQCKFHGNTVHLQTLILYVPRCEGIRQ